MIGGGIGATLALLFAPKRGSELRSEIADAASRRFDETRAAANRVKQRTSEYYAVAKEAGGEVMDVVTAGASAVRQEVSKDVERIGEIVEHSAKRAAKSASGTV